MGPRDLRELPDDAIHVGTFGRPHGVRGEVRLMPDSGDASRLLGLTQVWTVRDGEVLARRVRGVRVNGPAALMTLTGVDDRDAAADLTHAEAWAREAELPPLGPDEFRVDEVVGLELFDGTAGDGAVAVGKVVDVITVGGRDHFEVEVRGAGGRKALVPAVRDWLEELDVKGGRLVMRLPAGLLD